LLEMARASGVEVALDLAALPVLDGALECLQRGITSSLHDSNARQSSALAPLGTLANDANAALRLALLYDPQTAGGLLASLPAAQAGACIAALHLQGYGQSAVIAEVREATVPSSSGHTPISVVEQ
jgi:selenide,water dikinase